MFCISSQNDLLHYFHVCVCVSFPGEALRCNFCFSDDSVLCTPTSIQTCSGRANACGAVIFQGALSKYSVEGVVCHIIQEITPIRTEVITTG